MIVTEKEEAINRELWGIDLLDLKKLQHVDLDVFTREQLIRLNHRLVESIREIKGQIERAGDHHEDPDKMLDWFCRAERTLKEFGRDSQRVQLALSKKRRIEANRIPIEMQRLQQVYGVFRRELKRRDPQLYKEIVQVVREQGVRDGKA